MKKQPNRYYVRWVILCFIITTLPVVLLGLFSYAKSSGVVLEKMKKETALSLQQTQMNVEHSLKVVDQATTHFLGSKIIQTALNEPLNPDQFQLYTQVKTELSSLQRLDTGIDDIQIWSTAGNWLIKNDGLYRLDAWIKGNASAMPDPEAPSVWEISGSKAPSGSKDAVIPAIQPSSPQNESAIQLAAVNSCQINVNLLKKLPLTAYRSTGTAMIQIPACSISQLISVNADHEAVLLFDQDGRLIVHKGVTLDGLDESLQQSVKQLPEERTGQYNLNIDSQSLMVTYRKSDYNSWTYVSVVTLDQLTRSSREIGWFTLYICIGLLLLSIIAILLWTKRLYRPIAQIYKEVLSQIGRAASTKPLDEIQMIGEQVHSLFDTKRRLESRLEGQTELLRTFLMVKLFLFGMREGEIVERMESLGMRQDFSRFCVLALQIGSLENTRFTEKDIDLLLFAVNNMVGELIAADRRLHPIVLGRTQTTVLTSGADSEELFLSEVYAAARLVQQTAAEVLDLRVNIGISVPYQRLPDIPRAYEEAVEAAKRHAFFGDEGIGYFGDLGENHILHYSYPFALQSELFDSIKLVDRERVRPLLSELLHEIEQNNSNPYDMQFNAVRLLMNTLGLANGVTGQAIPMQRQQALFDELYQLSLPESGETWFMDQIIDPIMTGIEGHTEVRHLALSKQMVQMIHEEFDTDITIDTCADRLHYNSSYLATIFRKSMELSFSAYLAQHRHQIAIKWLLETDMPIKDIAERLRYNNSQNFIRSFRKTEGHSPGKFRELGRQDDGNSNGSASMEG
ncbi:helix-turn-helix domain-containing protein [Paenibacillus sp. UNC451MF]|uniref:helix-turn-helix domain-containing protein n=1 Tax=Paenibacillus sp. UNC451MF TaxID=1449063 RepID=UPI00048E1A2E|nr:helix-turn-helix domain-containing protein [Paenibacillus sp. UNC451MF]